MDRYSSKAAWREGSGVAISTVLWDDSVLEMGLWGG